MISSLWKCPNVVKSDLKCCAQVIEKLLRFVAEVETFHNESTNSTKELVKLVASLPNTGVLNKYRLSSRIQKLEIFQSKLDLHRYELETSFKAYEVVQKCPQI